MLDNLAHLGEAITMLLKDHAIRLMQVSMCMLLIMGMFLFLSIVFKKYYLINKKVRSQKEIHMVIYLKFCKSLLNNLFE